MSDLRTAAQQALEALKNNAGEMRVEGAISILETAVAQQAEPVEPVACLIGTKGSAFDLPTTKRAYTYAKQPGNVVASRLGLACNAAASQSAGDSIDRGLGLLQDLQKQGFGVFDLGAEYAAPPQRVAQQDEPAEPVEPVAWRYVPSEVWGDPVVTQDPKTVELARQYGRPIEPLYTAPPQRKPLTEEEIGALIHPVVMADLSDEMTDYEIARAVERAHGIKE